MAENKNDMKSDALREEVREQLKSFAEKIGTELGDNLESITVVGSSLTEDFRPGQSDINTVLVLKKQTADLLNVLSGMARWMSKRRLSAPLLMTAAYIERSRDVFGIEFLDFQLIHQTISGDDPFAKLGFAKADVRLQCERELKATLIRLRQGYISSAGRKKLIRDILVSAAGGLTPLLRAMLWLKDKDRSRQAEKVFTKAAVEFSINADSLITAIKWRHEKIRLSDEKIATVFESIYTTVEQLALIVDKLEV